MARKSLTVPMILAVLYAVAAPERCFGYGSEGHETVGAVADDLLQGTTAETHVHQLLNGDTLSNAATWADRVKGHNLDQEMHTYVTQNPKHSRYHYTDVPIQEVVYQDGTVGTDPNDIVHIMQQCIAVLQGNNTPTSNPHGFSERIALLLLAHFVGDIHQPLHVGAAYLNQKNRFVDPNIVHTGAQADEGGNFLRFDQKTILLHAYWDDNAVKLAMKKAGAKTPQTYAADIVQRSLIVPLTPGQPTTWPQKWAEEMLPIAAKAHNGIKAGAPSTVSDHFGPNHLQWPIQLPSGYPNLARDTVDDRLAVGGHRMAQLLEAIWP